MDEEKDLKRPKAIINERERRYLRGEEVVPKNTQHERDIRTSIRDRYKEAFKDLRYLPELSPKDRQMIMNDEDVAGPRAWRLEGLFAFLYLHFKHDHPLGPEWGFEDLIKKGVRWAGGYGDPWVQKPPEHVVVEADADVAITEPEEIDLATIQRKLDSDPTLLTEAEKDRALELARQAGLDEVIADLLDADQ